MDTYKNTYRLWHQLTLKLAEFIDHPLAQPYRTEVFREFVRDFEERLNPLRLVEMGAKVAEDIDSTFISPSKYFSIYAPQTPPSTCPS